MRIYKICLLIALIQLSTKNYSQGIISIDNKTKTSKDLTVGAERTSEYLPLFKGKRVAVVANQTSTIKKTNLIDSLLTSGIEIKKVFCPEHGFRGTVDAGEKVSSETDEKTGLRIITLYGKNKKPSATDLKDVDVVVFDIQDVGVRFYTYISTLHYVMEACAENKKQLILLDRPNPNGYYIDGPIMEDAYKSFLGMHSVPIIYALTIGEYAQMINGEGWLKGKIKCNLKVVTILGYSHKDLYQLPIKPSPNLPNMASVYLYPTLGLFEGTVMSVGRGTDLPFQIIGHPALQKAVYTFTPKPMLGAMEPKYNGKVCKGYNLADFGKEYMKDAKKLYLYWILGTYKNTPDKTTYFDDNFNYHAGNATLKQQIVDGKSEEEIRESWQDGIKKFKIVRKKYLLYKDFE